MEQPENLLACPFCGATPWHHLFGTTLVVGCANEKCVLHENTLGEHIQFTAENWNRRAGGDGVLNDNRAERLAPASWLDALDAALAALIDLRRARQHQDDPMLMIDVDRTANLLRQRI